MKARAIYRQGKMNGTEAAYASRLELFRRDGVIHSWAFEPVKLKLGRACYYSPDFMVVRCDGVLEFHEVKGHWRDDARVKFKVAAELFPFVFKAFKLERGLFVPEVFQDGEAVGG